MAELSQERRKLAVLQKRVNDPEYYAEVKRKAAEKKIRFFSTPFGFIYPGAHSK